MGLRTASVRHSHVEVMAPALTEPNQNPNFKFDDALHAEHSCKTTNNKELVLNTLATEILTEDNASPCKINCASGDILDSINSSQIMYNSSLPMGDQDQDKMGLNKATGFDNVLNLLKDKPTSEIDQIFNLPDNILSDLTGNLTNFEKEFLNDVDVMNISMEEPLIDLKETQTKELITQVNKKQHKLERKLEFSIRRLRKFQMRHMSQHISGEVAGVFEHVHRTLRRVKDESTPEIIPEIPPEKMKPISSSSAKNLVRKLEMSAILQSNAASRRHTGRYFGSGSSEPAGYRAAVTGITYLPSWVVHHKQDLHRVAGLLHTEMTVAQQELDSEATASSSGGESCDEMQYYNNPHQQYLSIQKRASWKYLTERAAVAARWTWLQAQISDLEYRIRQHSELHKNIRTSKGSVQLGGESPPRSGSQSPAAATLNGYRGQLPGAANTISKLSGSGECSAVSVNESSSGIGGNNNSSGVGNNNNSCSGGGKEYQCARTRPLVNFRKRKLLQTAGLHAVSKKAARPSTIRCGCMLPSLPCALCTGRTDPTHPRDPADYLSRAEKVAMLDPGFHPVFSLPEDCSAGLHLEAIMKTPDWQQRSSRPTIKCMKYIAKGDRMDKSNVPVEHRSKKLEHRKKYSRLLKPATVNALTAKIKNKFRSKKSGGSGRHPSSQMGRLNKGRHTQRLSMGSMSGDCEDEELEGLGGIAGGGKYDSPSTSPLLSTQSISGYQRRNRIDSYDIDNIVIPYSVAALTRVEKLQYKEILTPKWRIVDYKNCDKAEVKNNGAVKNPSQENHSDVEDISDEAMFLRHEKCEHEEKKKFLSYLKLPLGYGRSRSQKRTDSRAESSGANTPDPMSPHPVGDPSESVGSPLTSPPATPLSVTTDDSSNMSSSALRRRTISQSRFSKDKEPKDGAENRCVTPEHVEVPPFERRVFPLCDDTYTIMLKCMPEDHQFKTNVRAQDSIGLAGVKILNPPPLEDRTEFHDSESTESAYGDEDPNDPEWIEMERAKDRSKR